MDKWSGYPAERDRLLAAIAERAPNRTVVITGDVHSNWVYETRRGFDAPDRPVVAAEFVGTSISSGGDGNATVRGGNAATPSLKWGNNRRGYVVCSADANAWHADYRVVASVTTPGSPIETASSWRVEHGRAGIERA
jgi:alkaline phosphatase D